MRQDSLKQMLVLMEDLKGEFEKGEAASLGEALHEAWLIKRGLVGGISPEAIDAWYDRAHAAGASRGKILRALSDLRRIDLGFERLGSTIVFSKPNSGAQP